MSAPGCKRRLGPAISIVLAANVAAASCASPRPPAPARSPAGATPADHRPRITVQHDSGSERATAQQLARLLDDYDLAPWFFTAAVVVDDDVIPHSHPVLTLSTRHLRDDLLLLSTYVHEQSHWIVDGAPGIDAAVAELEARFPDLPVGYPDGASDHRSSYVHLGVNAFEYHALRRLAGELRAQQVVQFWATDHYRTLYRTVLDHSAEILAILKRHGIVPPRA